MAQQAEGEPPSTEGVPKWPKHARRFGKVEFASKLARNL